MPVVAMMFTPRRLPRRVAPSIAVAPVDRRPCAAWPSAHEAERKFVQCPNRRSHRGHERPSPGLADSARCDGTGGKADADPVDRRVTRQMGETICWEPPEECGSSALTVPHLRRSARRSASVRTASGTGVGLHEAPSMTMRASSQPAQHRIDRCGVRPGCCTGGRERRSRVVGGGRSGRPRLGKLSNEVARRAMTRRRGTSSESILLAWTRRFGHCPKRSPMRRPTRPT